MSFLEKIMFEDIPPVDPAHVERFWLFQEQQPAGSNASRAYAQEAIVQICGPECTDPMAVWARTTLIVLVTHHGLLDNWRIKSTLQKAVFEAGARVPLPNGLKAFEPEQLLSRLA